MAETINGPRLDPKSGAAQTACRVSARLWRRRQGSDRNRAAMAALAAGRGFRRPQCPRTLRHVADGPAMVRLEQSPPGRARRRRRAMGRRDEGAAGSRRLSRRGAGAPRPRRIAARAGRLQPGHDDGAACRPAAQARARLDRRLFRRADRARASQRSDARATSRGAPPPVLLVHGDQDPVIPLEALFVSSEELAKADIPNQWHLRWASAMASTTAACAMAGCSSPKASG